MSKGYSVSIKGLDEQIGKLENFPATAKARLVEGMQRSVAIVERNVKPGVPVFMNRLRNSIGSEVSSAGSAILGKVGSSLKAEEYPSVMEYGRKPGSMPPPAALERWVHLKLGANGNEIKRVAFVVARSIGKKGIKGHFFMQKGLTMSESAINAEFEAAVAAIAKDLEI